MALTCGWQVCLTADWCWLLLEGDCCIVCVVTSLESVEDSQVSDETSSAWRWAGREISSVWRIGAGVAGGSVELSSLPSVLTSSQQPSIGLASTEQHPVLFLLPFFKNIQIMYNNHFLIINYNEGYIEVKIKKSKVVH